MQQLVNERDVCLIDWWPARDVSNLTSDPLEVKRLGQWVDNGVVNIAKMFSGK